jgi:cob(I)alamin adenosyltransferase
VAHGSGKTRIYTKTGDGGTTGLLYGGRVRKDSPAIEINGAVDEAQAVIGVARANAERDSDLDAWLVDIERDLWVLMAEIATAPSNRRKLVPGVSLVTPQMVGKLEHRIDDLVGRFELPREFVVPGQAYLPALLDHARTVVRRAERMAVSGASGEESLVVPYLNRLSDLLWTMARWQEGSTHLAVRDIPAQGTTGSLGGNANQSRGS